MSETTTEKKTPLETYWHEPVSKLATIEPALDPKPLSAALAERHRLYSLGLMAITHHYWNGLKKGRGGTYPWNPDPATAGGKHLLDDYRGHNIAGFAVDKLGYIIDFEFNHNKLMNSSAEHAEARLVRRIFSLNQIHDSWDVRSSSNPAASDYNTFEEVTVYTTLESCSQCSGIMALARVREVVYLQTDPGMYRIGNILRNLTRGTSLESPYPRPATDFGFKYLAELDAAYKAFAKEVGQKPFHISLGGKLDTSDSLTSFLCTDDAYRIYGRAAAALDFLGSEITAGRMPLDHPDAHPVDRSGSPVPSGLTNFKALEEILSFLKHAKEKGRRGTPHR
jgi:tRNA(Arg) A34 adenosine deaminase TadA